MRQVYSFLMYLLTPYLLLRLWWKGRELPAYRQRIAERFCLDNKPQEKVDIWIHAVSLGEVIAVIPLVNSLLDKKWRILMTTMTPTGSERVKTYFGDKVSHCYLPYDLPLAVNRFFKKVQPRLGIFVETELWPNLIYYATKKANIPLLLVNARLSDYSFRGYKKVAFLFNPLLNKFKFIFTQSEDDAWRFKALGAKDSKVIALGNIKFDLQTENVSTEVFLKLKNSWGNQRTVVILASTHDNEEQQLLVNLKKLQLGIPNMVLLVAPRHPERFQKVYEMAREFGFNTGLRSRIDTLSPDNDVIILDSLGELLGFYQISDYAFVGGSLVPVGGHNMLEPIAMRVPVFSGNQVHNFKAICRDLKAAQAIELVDNANDFVERIINLHHDENRKRKLVENATAVLESNKGTVARYVTQVEALLS